MAHEWEKYLGYVLENEDDTVSWVNGVHFKGETLVQFLSMTEHNGKMNINHINKILKTYGIKEIELEKGDSGDGN